MKSNNCGLQGCFGLWQGWFGLVCQNSARDGPSACFPLAPLSPFEGWKELGLLRFKGEMRAFSGTGYPTRLWWHPRLANGSRAKLTGTIFICTISARPLPKPLPGAHSKGGVCVVAYPRRELCRPLFSDWHRFWRQKKSPVGYGAPTQETRPSNGTRHGRWAQAINQSGRLSLVSVP